MSFSPKVLAAVAKAEECNNFEDPFEVMRLELLAKKAAVLLDEAIYLFKRRQHIQNETARKHAKICKERGITVPFIPHGVGPSSKMSRPPLQ